MIFQEKYVLANGQQIPKFALGTWQVGDEEAEKAVETALAIGYRHIDTAVGYGNESGVGRGIKASGISREEIYITSKVPAEVKSYEKAKEVILESLERLGVESIDLMLIHAPRPWSEMYPEAPNRYFEENRAVWRALEEAYKDGKLKAIGVSNFEVDDLQNIMGDCEIKPMVNQIRIHIGHTPKNVMEFCESAGILVEAYSPIFTGRLLDNAEVAGMAEKYGVSIPQLCVKYVLQLGTVALPKTTKEAHMRQNADVEFHISEEDMDVLKRIQLA